MAYTAAVALIIVHSYVLRAEGAIEVRTIRKTYYNIPLNSPNLPILYWRQHILNRCCLLVSLFAYPARITVITIITYDHCYKLYRSPQTSRHPSTIIAVLYARAIDVCVLNAFADIVWSLLGVRTESDNNNCGIIIVGVRVSRVLANHSILLIIKGRPPPLASVNSTYSPCETRSATDVRVHYACKYSPSINPNFCLLFEQSAPTTEYLYRLQCLVWQWLLIVSLQAQLKGTKMMYILLIPFAPTQHNSKPLITNLLQYNIIQITNNIKTINNLNLVPIG